MAAISEDMPRAKVPDSWPRCLPSAGRSRSLADILRAMFSVTYLGQQGWLIAGARGRILVDPLLTDEYSPGFQAAIYPPRAFDHARFPPIDAVVLSHEHADHLSVPSLALLDRRI